MKYVNKHGAVVVEIVCPDETLKFHNCTCESGLISMGMLYGQWRLSPDAHFRDDNGAMDPKSKLDSAVGDVYFVNSGWDNKRPRQTRSRPEQGRKRRSRLWRRLFFLCLPLAKQNAQRNATGSNGKVWSWKKFAYVFVEPQAKVSETALSVAHNTPRLQKQVHFREPLVEFIPHGGYALYAPTKEEMKKRRQRRVSEELWRRLQHSLVGRLLLL